MARLNMPLPLFIQMNNEKGLRGIFLIQIVLIVV